MGEENVHDHFSSGKIERCTSTVNRTEYKIHHPIPHGFIDAFLSRKLLRSCISVGTDTPPCTTSGLTSPLEPWKSQGVPYC